eukprot:c15054_g1_i1 orf=277-2343(+)
MASKLTSQAPCAHRSNEEMGGVGAKGCCGNLKWNAGGRQQETWINGFFCDDYSLTSNFNSGGTGIESAPHICQREYSEVDWKEIACQELVTTDRPTPWLDLGTARNDLFKDDLDIDVVSILTAVASVFRDWCIVEKELAESVLNEKLGKFSSLSRDQVYFNDTKINSSKEAEMLTSLLVQNDGSMNGSFDFPLDRFLKEHYKSQPIPISSRQSCSSGKEGTSERAQVFGMNSFEEKSQGCERKNFKGSPISEEQFKIRGNIMQCNRLEESKEKSVCDEAREQNFLAADGDLNSCMNPFASVDMHAIFGKQTSAASRFSFGREDGALSLLEAERMAPSRVSENCEVSDCSVSRDLTSANEKPNRIGFGGQYEGVKVEQVTVQGQDLVPEALQYTLSYMSLQELLTMEKVCRSLRIRIKSDVLLWQRLHIELPMSNFLTDEVLLELASRAGGQLQSLSLVDCTRVTEAALEQVILSNPKLAKLSLPGCSRISADAVVRMVEILTNCKVSGMAGLKQLRVRNMYGFTKQHLESLQKMVGVRPQDQSISRKPQYYHQKHHASFHDDDIAIDVEECPKCSNIKLVYDCTREKCQQRKGGDCQDCRACILCIGRCEACGSCITDNDYEETFSLDVLCSCCWLGLPKCAECNRPACGSHADHFIRTPEITFVCGDCCGTLPETNGLEFRVCAEKH